jgi:hypothetical protein
MILAMYYVLIKTCDFGKEKPSHLTPHSLHLLPFHHKSLHLLPHIRLQSGGWKPQ